MRAKLSERPVTVGDKVLPHDSHVVDSVPTAGGTTYWCPRCGGEVFARWWRSANGRMGTTELGVRPCEATARAVAS